TCRRIGREVWRHVARTVRRTQFGRSAGSEDYICAVGYAVAFQIGTILNALFTGHDHSLISMSVRNLTKQSGLDFPHTQVTSGARAFYPGRKPRVHAWVVIR